MYQQGEYEEEYDDDIFGVPKSGEKDDKGLVESGIKFGVLCTRVDIPFAPMPPIRFAVEYTLVNSL